MVFVCGNHKCDSHARQQEKVFPTHIPDATREMRELMDLLGDPTQDAAAKMLGVERGFVNRVLNGHKPSPPFAKLISTQLALLKRNTTATRVGEAPSSYAPSTQPRETVVAFTKPLAQSPSTRADCEQHFAVYLDAAEASGNPDAMPHIASRLRKEFPLDEWEPREDKT